MSDDMPTTATKPKSLMKAVTFNESVTIVIDSVRDTHDMPGADGNIHEDLFTVLGHTVPTNPGTDVIYYAGEAEVEPGTTKPSKGEVWTFTDDADMDDSFPLGTKEETTATVEPVSNEQAQ